MALHTHLPCRDLCQTQTNGVWRHRPGPWERTLGFKVKAERERRPRWPEWNVDSRDCYHFRARLSWGIVSLLPQRSRPSLVQHTGYFQYSNDLPSETPLQPDRLICPALLDPDLSPPLWFCSCLLLPGMFLFNTQLKSTTSTEAFLSCQPQIISCPSETTPYIPFIK